MESDERVSVVFDQCEQDLSMNWLRMKRYRGHQRHIRKSCNFSYQNTRPLMHFVEVFQVLQVFSVKPTVPKSVVDRWTKKVEN